MKPPRSGPVFHALLVLCLVWSTLSCGAGAPGGRVPWKSSHVFGTPEPPPPYTLARAFPKLEFSKPIEATTIPGTNRLLLVEELGKLRSFRADESADKSELVLDLQEIDPAIRQCYSLAFHPRFLENRFVYVMFFQLEPGKPNLANGSRIVRFVLPESDPPRIDPASGVTIFRWEAGGHNGSCIRFGPDGMLYISTGDAGGAEPPDPLATGQNITDPLSCILRIDVDHPAEGRAYGTPKDNPFVGVPGACGEIWAYGLRNPWRIAFDRASGELYAGDVGWERWEMIHRITRGGNYGWSVTEATRQDVIATRERGPTQILPPLVAHPHEEAASITGGEFYHGKLLPELRGAYIYVDWQMGTFWALRARGDTVTSHREIARSNLMPAGFATLPDGEILACDHAAGGLWRILPNPDAGRNVDFPTKLSKTGLFKDTPSQVPAEGVLPYSIRAERWKDHAHSSRWIGVPSLEPVTSAPRDTGVLRAGRWIFPKDTVLAKTYVLEMEAGNPATARPIETQILHFGGQQPAAYTYRWNTDHTDAELVPEKGADATFSIRDAAAPGGMRQQPWRFNSRSECIRCHTVWNDFAAAFNDLNLEMTTADAPGNQLDRLAALGLASPKPRIVRPDDKTQTLELRARSYLHANCAGCHRKNGGGAVPSYFDIDLPLKESRLLDQAPIQGGLGLNEARVIAPGDPERSVALYRMASTGRGHMPYLGAHLADAEGIRLVRDWIASMRPTHGKLPPEAQSRRKLEHAALAKLISGDESALDTLFASSSGALAVALALNDDTVPPSVRQGVIRKGYALTDPMQRDLFERFLAPGEHRQQLGASFDPQTVLEQKGDAVRGGPVFQALCASCHKVGDSGIDFGPNLISAAKRYPRAELLEHIRNPSLRIDPEWQLTTLTLDDGSTRAGFISAKSANSVLLRLPGGFIEKIPAGKISATRAENRVSLMPEGLLQTLSPKEAADLLAWLVALASH